MATIETLNIAITASIKGVESGIKKATSLLAGFQKFVTSASGALAGLGIALSAAAFGQFLARQSEAVDQMARLSDITGIATEKLIGLQLAAGLKGGTEELGSSLIKMNKNISDAIGGNDKAVESFSKLGISVEELKNLSPDEAFSKIAQSISELQSPADKTAAAMAIFGKSGAQLLPLLNSGAAGIAEAQKEAERLGITFSRFDAARVEQANDAMEKLGRVAAAAGQQLLIELAPAFTAVIDMTLEWIKEAGGIKAILQPALEYVIPAFEFLGNLLSVLNIAWLAQKTYINGVTSAMIYLVGYVVKGVEYMTGATTGWGDAMIDTAASFKNEAIKSAKELRTAIDQATLPPKTSAADFFKQAQARADAAAKATVGLKTATRGFSQAQEEAKDTGAKLIDSLKEQVATFGLSTTQVEIYKASLKGITADELAQANVLAAQLKALEDKKKLTEDIASKQKEATEELQRQADEIKKSAATPLQKFQTELAEIRKVFNAGLIDEATARAQIKNITKDFADAQDPVKDFKATSASPGGALDSRSTEAFSMIFGEKSKANKQLEKNTEKSFKAQQETNRLLKLQKQTGLALASF